MYLNKRTKRVFKETARGVGKALWSGTKKGYSSITAPQIDKTRGRIKRLEAEIKLQGMRAKEKRLRAKAYGEGKGGTFGNY